MTNNAIVDTAYPALYQATNCASIKAQKIYYRVISFILFLLVGASISSLFSSDNKFSAILTTVLLSVVPIFIVTGAIEQAKELGLRV